LVGIGIIGAKGRMGRAIAAELEHDGGGQLAAQADQGDDLDAFVQACDIVIDFSAPAALPGNLTAAGAAKRPVVVGTTGLDRDHHQLIDRMSAEVAVLQAANMSLGVNLLAHLVREAAARLGTRLGH
jgi:4-hydroxy-tetrahydrodipicolinate reductase